MADALLVDGYSIVFRSHYAHARDPLARKDGFPTSALFGFATTVLRLLKDHAPARAFVAFDAGRDTFRRERYPDYKAQRIETPEDLKRQLPAIFDFVDALRIPRKAMQGFEADDLIGTLAAAQADSGGRALVVSGDRDLFQVVGERVSVLYIGGGLAKAEEYTPASMVGKTGMRPEQVPDYKALCGDASDNIPGVPGIGAKTALDLLARFGTLEGIYANLDGVPGKAKQAALAEHRDRAFLALELARIRCDVPLGISPEELDWPGIDADRCLALLDEYEMPSLRKRVEELRGRGGHAQMSLF